MAVKTKSYVGKKINITAGTRVNRYGEATRQSRDATVTVIAEETSRGGKTRVYWKSNGDRSTNTLI